MKLPAVKEGIKKGACMQTKKIGSKIYKLLRESNYKENTKDIMVIKGEKATSYGRKIIDLEMSDDFISVWVGNQTRDSRSNQTGMEVNLYVYNRHDISLWIGAMTEPDRVIESRLLSPRSIEYLCALNSMKCFIGDLFLMRPYDLRVLEIMDMVGDKPPRSSTEKYLRVLYKMISND